MNPCTTCPDCQGTGADPDHHWPDGSAAACQTCEGYGDLGPLPTREQFHKLLKQWAEEHGKEYIDVPLCLDEFATPEEIKARCEISTTINQLLTNQ
jgi:hypothetical protein